jgi:hypothetical protein
MTMMPFGKHRGTPLSELPGGYVDWLSSKLIEWREPFRSELAAEIERRNGRTLPGMERPTPDAAPRGAKPHRAAAAPASTTVCDVCGLGPTAQRPLVHASCVNDEVPF